MQPVNFEGAKVVGKPKSMTDEQCMPVYASAGIDGNGFGYYEEAWKPSYEDLRALNRGEPIRIRIYSNGLPPISMFTLDENGNCNDAN